MCVYAMYILPRLWGHGSEYFNRIGEEEKPVEKYCQHHLPRPSTSIRYFILRCRVKRRKWERVRESHHHNRYLHPSAKPPHPVPSAFRCHSITASAPNERWQSAQYVFMENISIFPLPNVCTGNRMRFVFLSIEAISSPFLGLLDVRLLLPRSSSTGGWGTSRFKVYMRA